MMKFVSIVKGKIKTNGSNNDDVVLREWQLEVMYFVQLNRMNANKIRILFHSNNLCKRTESAIYSFNVKHVKTLKLLCSHAIFVK